MISKAKVRLRTFRGAWSYVKAGASRSRAPKLALLLGFALLASLVLGVTLGAAAAPSVTVNDASEVKFQTAHVSGTVDPQGQSSFYHFDYISDAQYQQNLSNSVPGFEGAEFGYGESTETAGPVSGELTNLRAGTVYHLRLQAENGDGPAEAVAADTFETLDVNDPSASIDPVTTFTGTTAHFTGTVNPNAPSGSLDQAEKDAYRLRWDFQCTPSCPGLKGGFIEAEEGSKAVAADASGLEPNTSYEVKLTVSNASGPQSSTPVSFHTPEVGPGVETLPAFALGSGTEAQVGGWVNPKNTATTYWVEYGISTGYGQSIPASKDASAGSGGQAQVFTETIEGLAPSTEYHARLVAENSAGQETQGNDVNFETAPGGPPPAESCGNETLRRENNSTELPECRAYEQVSPTDKNGFDAAYATDFGPNGYPISVAAEDGSAVTYESRGGFGDTQSAGVLVDYISRRESSGWTTHGLNPPQNPSLFIAGFPSFDWFSPPDLRYGIMRTNGETGSLAPGDVAGAPNVYLRDNLTGSLRTLSLESSIGEPGSDPDTPPVIFPFEARPLTPDALPGQTNVYEWNDGHIELASVDTNGDPIPSAVLRQWQSTSAGTVLVTQSDCCSHVYLRKANGQVVEATKSRLSTPDSGSPGVVRFGQLSADGTKAYFTGSSARLTEDAQPDGSALYRYDATTDTLTDLTSSALGKELVISVAAVSRDGSSVAFYAHSQFHAGENENDQAESSNIGLYLWHDGTIRFIGTDDTDPFFKTETSYDSFRLSPDGTLLSFNSSARLSAYDNTDATLGENGNPRRDEEVYVYDTELSRLTCVSCNPSGQQPSGTPGGVDGGSAIPDPPNRQASNTSPGARDDGTIFFGSRDALVPQDVNGKLDVYEWKGGRVRLISSGTDGRPTVLASSSASGNDVFISTGAHLVPADQDGLVDVYDARVGGGFPKAPTPSPCEGTEGCHGPASNPPPVTNPASGSLSGSKQPSPSAARLKAARKACNRKPKKARAKCRAKAKKHFTKAGRAH